MKSEASSCCADYVLRLGVAVGLAMGEIEINCLNEHVFPAQAARPRNAYNHAVRILVVGSVAPRRNLPNQRVRLEDSARIRSAQAASADLIEVLPLTLNESPGDVTRGAQSQLATRGPCLCRQGLVSACASTCARAIRVSADSVDRVEPPAAELYSLARRRRAIWPALGSLHLPLSRGPSISVPPAPASTSQHGRGLSGRERHVRAARLQLGDVREALPGEG